MKVFLTYLLFPAMLLILLQPVILYAQHQDPDSLRQVMRSVSDEFESLHASILLAQEMMPDQMDSARIFLEWAHPIEKSPILRHRAQYNNVWGLYYWYSRERQASIDWFRKTLALAADETILSLQAAAANNIGSLYVGMGLPDSARVYLMGSLELDMERGYETGVAKTSYDLGRLHLSMDQHELALPYINEAIRIQHADGDTQRLMHSYNVLGNIYLTQRQPESATEAYEMAQAYARQLDMQRMVVMIYSNLSSIWCTREDGFEKAMRYIEPGLDGAYAAGETDLVAVLLINKAQTWLTAGESAKALELFLEAREIVLQLNDTYKEMDVSHRMGMAYRELGDYERARREQQRSLVIAVERQSLGYQSKALLEMAALDSLQHDYVSFARHYVRGTNLRDSIWNQEKQIRIAELQIIHETEQKALEIEQLTQQSRVRKLSIIFLAVGAGLVLILFVFVFLYLGKRQKLIRQQYLLQQQRAEHELAANKRELTGKALSLARSDQLLTQLKKDLGHMLSNPDHDNNEDILSTLRLLKSNDNSQRLWTEFETRFNELNDGFISRLSSRYPTLSPAEIRLCAMLRLQLSTKDIAEMIKRSTRTIEHTRTSIRKKMNLTVGDNLVQHILNV